MNPDYLHSPGDGDYPPPLGPIPPGMVPLLPPDFLAHLYWAEEPPDTLSISVPGRGTIEIDTLRFLAFQILRFLGHGGPPGQPPVGSSVSFIPEVDQTPYNPHTVQPPCTEQPLHPPQVDPTHVSLRETEGYRKTLQFVPHMPDNVLGPPYPTTVTMD